jgi:hypothetical protein
VTYDNQEALKIAKRTARRPCVAAAGAEYRTIELSSKFGDYPARPWTDRVRAQQQA